MLLRNYAKNIQSINTIKLLRGGLGDEYLPQTDNTSQGAT